jgi:hypothetical protein
MVNSGTSNGKIFFMTQCQPASLIFTREAYFLFNLVSFSENYTKISESETNLSHLYTYCLFFLPIRMDFWCYYGYNWHYYPPPPQKPSRDRMIN